MNRTVVCVLALFCMFCVSLYIYDFSIKSLKQNEDIKHLQDQGWSVDNMTDQPTLRRQKRSIASICNGLWRLLNYPYMYNFYPILNFGVAKIMSGLGSLINNIHFPLFSSLSSTIAPLSESELQAQELANAQGQALSQEAQTSTTETPDYQEETSPTTHSVSDSSEAEPTPPPPNTDSADSYTSPPQTSQESPEGYRSPPKRMSPSNEDQEYQPNSREDEMRRAREEEQERSEEERMVDMKKKIDEKAGVLAKKYVERYFSQNKQLAGDLSMSAISNMIPTVNDVELPKSIEDQLAHQNT